MREQRVGSRTARRLRRGFLGAVWAAWLPVVMFCVAVMFWAYAVYFLAGDVHWAIRMATNVAVGWVLGRLLSAWMRARWLRLEP